jgi:hypothetical protein
MNLFILLDGMRISSKTLILMTEYLIFLEFLPFETLISQTQDDIYKIIVVKIKSGKSTFYRILGVLMSNP